MRWSGSASVVSWPTRHGRPAATASGDGLGDGDRAVGTGRDVAVGEDRRRGDVREQGGREVAAIKAGPGAARTRGRSRPGSPRPSPRSLRRGRRRARAMRPSKSSRSPGGSMSRCTPSNRPVPGGGRSAESRVAVQGSASHVASPPSACGAGSHAGGPRRRAGPAGVAAGIGGKVRRHLDEQLADAACGGEVDHGGRRLDRRPDPHRAGAGRARRHVRRSAGGGGRRPPWRARARR